MKNQGKSSNSGNSSKNSKSSSKGYEAKSNHDDDRGYGNDGKDCRNDQSWDDKGKGGNNGKDKGNNGKDKGNSGNSGKDAYEAKDKNKGHDDHKKDKGYDKGKGHDKSKGHDKGHDKSKGHEDKDHYWSDDHDNGDNGHGYGHQHSNGKGHDNHKGWGWGHHKHGCGDHDGDSDGDTGGGDTGGTALAALDDSAAGLASAIIVGNVLDNDTGSSLIATLISDVARGTLVLQDDGSFTFEPGEDFVALAEGETSVETFTYSITGADGGVDEASVTITVTGVNDAPEAQDANYVYPQGEFDVPHYIDLGGLVSDPDGDALSISLVDASGNHVDTLTLGNGEDDYAVVTLVGNQLEVVTSFFMVSGESIDIDYVVTDVHGESDLGLIGVQVLHGAPPVT